MRQNTFCKIFSYHSHLIHRSNFTSDWTLEDIITLSI